MIPAQLRAPAVLALVVVAVAGGFLLRGWLDVPAAAPTTAAISPPTASAPADPANRTPRPTPKPWAKAVGPGDVPMPTAEEAAARVADLRLQADTAFAREPVNAAWAAPIEADLVRAASSDDAVASGETPVEFKAECRSRSCRVIAVFGPDADGESWAGGYLIGAAGHLSLARILARRLPDGRIEVTIHGTGD